MQPFDYFDIIFCINLDRRTDRWEQSLLEFEKMGIKDRVIRMPGIETSNPALGCHLSHAACLEYAKMREVNNILILEDDVEFFPAAMENLHQALVELPTVWDMFYLGANLHTYPAYQISDHIAKLQGAYSTHAYAVRHDIFDELIEVNVSSNIAHNDVYYSDVIIPNRMCYLALPLIAGQRDSYSDILKTEASSNAMFQRRLNRNLVRWTK